MAETTRRTARTERKRSEILRAALPVFQAGGYLGTSVDEISAAARTSKRTVYGYFGDKEGLFREVIRSTIAPLQDSLQEQIDQAAGGDARTSLRELIHRLATIVITPQVVRLRRLVIAETDRFPDLAAEWYRLGPEQTVARLTAYLEDLNRSGELRIDDLAGAAEQLLWLSVSAPLNRLMFAPSGAIPRRGELRRNGDAALETFWRAYATNP